ncbi:Nudix hydrolase domain-containing protein [Aphelenchoides besseyi]|nr:Nudix hydrolase domain-containing protein [Aphelenchoides besseyi]KAI6208199.1 Nudix hydrolase domain-containing protein [Aphelenchoides besseyi]
MSIKSAVNCIQKARLSPLVSIAALHFSCLQMADNMSNFVHKKCRDTNKPYSKSEVYRFEVPDDKVDWNTPFDSYKPPDYIDKSTIGKPWADGELNSRKFKWNEMDGDVNRESYIRKYEVVDGRPRNPMGRTGLQGRGILGKWGPNHAADPIVSRFKNGTLQFVAIKRGDTGEWAIPGGMVDAGEEVSATLKREFTEETLNNVENKEIESLWKKGVQIYKGYVDDPRNTDNSWMETVVMNFHDNEGLLDNGGDDATDAQFVDVKPGFKLYASHDYFIKKFAERHGVKL